MIVFGFLGGLQQFAHPQLSEKAATGGMQC